VTTTTEVPRVTVVIPARNAERDLPRALDSIVAQTYVSWKAVVVDDASSDGTGDVARAFAERWPGRFTVLREDENVGVPRARNAGVAASGGGELLALLDADDYWREDYLARSIELYDEGLATGRAVGIVACNALLEGPGGIASQTFADFFGWTEPITYDDMIERNCILARAVLSRAAYDEVGGFAPECAVRDASRGLYAASDDYDMWLRVMEAGYEVVSTRETIAVYRHDVASASHNPLMHAEANMSVYRRALDRGRVSPGRRRALKARMRHYRALRERALVYEALAARRPLAVPVRALRAAPWGLIALLQKPSRWGEWVSSLRYRRATLS